MTTVNSTVKFFGAFTLATVASLVSAGEANAIVVVDDFTGTDQSVIVDENPPVNPGPTAPINLFPASSDLDITRILELTSVTGTNDIDRAVAASLTGTFRTSLDSGVSATSTIAYDPASGLFDLLNGMTSADGMEFVLRLGVLESTDEGSVTIELTDVDSDVSVASVVLPDTGGTLVTDIPLDFSFATDFDVAFGTGASEVDLAQLNHFDIIFNLPNSADISLESVTVERVPFEAETSAGLALLVGYGAFRRWKSRRVQAS